MSWWMFVIVVGVLLGLAWLMVFGKTIAKSEQYAFLSEEELRLQVVCGGDKAQVTRLIKYELRHVPGITRREAALRALQSYRRDNT